MRQRSGPIGVGALEILNYILMQILVRFITRFTASEVLWQFSVAAEVGSMGYCEVLRGSGDLTCATDCGLNVSPRYSYSDRTHRSGADSGFNWY